MTYLITGATGFLGRGLVDMLLAGGCIVHYLGRKRDASMDSRVGFHLWEHLNSTPSLESVPRVDAVIHLAGEPIAQRWTSEKKKSIRDSRVVGTQRLVEALGRLRHKPKALVSASAIGFYGDRSDEILTEKSAPGNGFLAELCREWEREAGRASELGMRVVQVRIGVVLGHDGGALKQMLPVFRTGLGGQFGDGRQWVSWIERDDLLRMFRWAAETGDVEGVLNGTAPNPVTNADFTKALARVVNRPAFFRVPKSALRIALGEMADFLYDSIRAVPEAAEQHGFQFACRDLDRALSRAVQPTTST
jgi:uncharacterized protein